MPWISCTCTILPYLGDDLDLHSASEDEESAEVDDAVSDDGSNSDTEKPAVSRTLTVFLEPKEGTRNKGGVTPVMDDSETESESESEPVVQTLKRKSLSSSQVVPPAKRQQIPSVEGMS